MPVMYGSQPWWRKLLCTIGLHEPTFVKYDACLYCILDKRTAQEKFNDALTEWRAWLDDNGGY